MEGQQVSAPEQFRNLDKMVVLCAIVFLLWSNVYVHSHVDVYSHAVPYVTFMGKTLPNNSYVDLSLVGDPLSGGEGVQCHTDLTTCCSRHQGNDNGNWYAPDSVTRLSLSGHLNTTFQCRESQKVTLYHRSRVLPSDHQSGMYRCDIAVNGSGRGTVYIGIYETGGTNIIIIVLLKTYMSLIYIHAGDINIFGISTSMDSILTCISTGGPATNVTLTTGNDENNLVPVSDNTPVSVLVNATIARYTHTFKFSGTVLSNSTVYGCSVSNNKPSSAKVIVTIDYYGIYKCNVIVYMKYIIVVNTKL